MENRKSFNTGEVTLSYFEGPANGQPLVLLHGLTLNNNEWATLLPELTRHWHVYAPELRGHGQSGRAPDNQYRIVDYARDIIAFLKQIGQPVVLIGHSLGGLVAILAAARYPEGVSALVLLDPPLFSFAEGVDGQQSTKARFQMVSALVKDNPPYETVVARLRTAMPQAPEPMIMGLAGFITGVDAGTVDCVLRDQSWDGENLPDAERSLRCPTLLIHGDWDRDAAVRPQDVDEFKANVPAATVIHIAQADHFLKMFEQPNLVLDGVKQFLQPA